MTMNEETIMQRQLRTSEIDTNSLRALAVQLAEALVDPNQVSYTAASADRKALALAAAKKAGLIK